MSLPSFERRLERLERGNRQAEASSAYIEAVNAVERMWDERRAACKAMIDFARALAGTLDAPMPRDELPDAGVPGVGRADGPIARTFERPPEPRPRFDPAFGGRIIAPHGGLGSSADALRCLPPPPEPEPPAPVPRERWPWEHWGVLPPRSE